MVDCGVAYLPIVHSRLFGHEFVNARAALTHASNSIDVSPRVIIGLTSRSMKLSKPTSSANSLLPLYISPVLRHRQAGMAIAENTRS